MDKLLQDIRYGVRTLGKRPGFTVVAVLTLALGIGANTAIFSVVNAVLLSPLPYERADRLVAVFEQTPAQERNYISRPNLEDYAAGSQTFEEFSASVGQSVNLTGVEQPDRLIGNFITSGFFRVLRARPAHGRLFHPAEDAPGAERVAVLSHSTWQTRFGSDPTLVGRVLNLNGEPYTVVGILPEGFRAPGGDFDVYMPAQFWPNYKFARNEYQAYVFGRLKEGVTLEEAGVELATISKRLEAAFPEENRGRTARVISLQELLVEDVRQGLLILLASVGFILLIACANIANLLLARGAARLKEVAVRSALGASRWRIVRQLLTESVLIGLAGGVLGTLVALWGVDLLMSMSPGELPGGQRPGLDARVLAFTLGVSVVTGLLFGLMPALHLSKPDLNETLKEGRTTGASGGARGRLRSAFIVSEVALSLVLLVGAGLLVNSFYRLLGTSPGFDPSNLLTMEYRLPRNKYPKESQQWEFHRQVVERVSQLPGVESVAQVRALPFSGNGGSAVYVLPDKAPPAPGAEPRALTNSAGPGYFETVRLPLVRGRYFDARDTADAPPVVVVNQTLARLHWPDEDPIGKQVQIPELKFAGTVVGVVGDARQYQLSEVQQPQIYSAFAQTPFIFSTLVVRTKVEPMTMAGTVREAVWSVDRDQPVWKIRTVESLLRTNVASRRFVMSLMTGFAALALLLTALGLYGVMAYVVSQRTHEIGVRMALGAQARDVLRLMLRQGMTLALVGVGCGLVAAFAATRAMRSMLYGVTAADPLTFASVSAVLVLVALLACYLPARRATKVDPMEALRYE